MAKRGRRAVDIDATSEIYRRITDLEEEIKLRPRFIPSSIYIDDRKLSVDSATVDFNIPLAFHVLRLSWFAWSDAEGDSLAFLNINDTFVSPDNDYFWNLSLQNQQGSQGSATDSLSNNGGGLGYIYGDNNGGGWGTIELPNYNVDFSSLEEAGGPVYTGNGGWSRMAGQTPDTWTVAGYYENVTPTATLSVSVSKIAGLVAAKFRANSRFTLVAY